MRLMTPRILVLLTGLCLLGCGGGEPAPEITGPITLVFSTEPTGRGFKVRIDELSFEAHDLARISVAPPKVKLSAYMTSSHRELVATVEASMTKTDNSVTINAELENTRDLRIRIDGLAEPLVTTGDGKPIRPEDVVPPGKHSLVIKARIGGGGD